MVFRMDFYIFKCSVDAEVNIIIASDDPADIPADATSTLCTSGQWVLIDQFAEGDGTYTATPSSPACACRTLRARKQRQEVLSPRRIGDDGLGRAGWDLQLAEVEQQQVDPRRRHVDLPGHGLGRRELPRLLRASLGRRPGRHALFTGTCASWSRSSYPWAIVFALCHLFSLIPQRFNARFPTTVRPYLAMARRHSSRTPRS